MSTNPTRRTLSSVRLARHLEKGLIYLILLSGGLLILVPLWWMISTSLKRPAEVFTFPPTFLPETLRWQNYVDIFDAGPTIEVAREDIQTIKKCQFLKIADIAEPENQTRYLIGNHQLSFKATLGAVDIQQDGAIIHQDIAHLLQVKIGDFIACSPLINGPS